MAKFWKVIWDAVETSTLTLTLRRCRHPSKRLYKWKNVVSIASLFTRFAEDNYSKRDAPSLLLRRVTWLWPRALVPRGPVISDLIMLCPCALSEPLPFVCCVFGGNIRRENIWPSAAGGYEPNDTYMKYALRNTQGRYNTRKTFRTGCDKVSGVLKWVWDFGFFAHIEFTQMHRVHPNA